MSLKLVPRTQKVIEFISKLFLLRIQAHIFHLQTKSLAEHLALDEVYNGIVDLTDELIETYQGTNEVLKGYKLGEVTDHKTKEQVIKYLDDLLSYIEDNREEAFKDSDLLNIVDEIKSLLKKGLYKLKNLS